MVLKDLNTTIDGGDCWVFYDNIATASYYYDKETKSAVVGLVFNGCDKAVTVPIERCAYLCNDRGETIEKFYRADAPINVNK